MIHQNGAELLPISSWHPQLLRFTAFPKAPIDNAELGWWKNTVGSPPENVSSNARIELRQEEGETKLGHLVLAILPMRIDWLLPEELEKPETLTPDESLNEFHAYVERWLEMAPIMQRLAFGAVIEVPMQNRPSGYRQLSPYLPFVQIDADASSDFLYQINRPRDSTSGIQGLRINRLSKWSVSVKVSSVAPVIAGQQELRIVPTREKYACRLELDINSVPQSEIEFSKEAAATVVRELLVLGLEIASKGDVK